MRKFFVRTITLIVFTFIFLNSKVLAAGLGISASTKTVTQGGSVTITINASDLIGRFSVTSSNGNVLSGGTSSEWIENGSKSYRFTAKSLGTATITVNALDVSSTSGQKFTGSKSITINVVKPREKSTNNYLSSLSVEGFTLSPEFSKDQLEYSVEVPAETEKIQIHAGKADSYASLDGIGEKEVSEGDNRFEIKVTSETGNERVYVINVNVKDNNPISVKMNGNDYTVVKKASSLQKPELFEDTKVEIDGFEVPGFYNETSKITLIGLRNQEGKIVLAIYNEKEKSYTKYQPVTSSNITIVSLPNEEGFKKYSKVTVKLGEEEYEGYQISSKSNFIYLYGLRVDSGKKAWYVYDKEEKTLQLYQEEEAKKIEQEYKEKLNEHKIVIACLSGLSLVLAIVILILVYTRKSGMKKKNDNLEKTMDLQKTMNLQKTMELKKPIELQKTVEIPKIDPSENTVIVDDDFLDILGSKKEEVPAESEEKKEEVIPVVEEVKPVEKKKTKPKKKTPKKKTEEISTNSTDEHKKENTKVKDNKID